MVTGKDEESKKGGKLQMMRRVADETNLESLKFAVPASAAIRAVF